MSTNKNETESEFGSVLNFQSQAELYPNKISLEIEEKSVPKAKTGIKRFGGIFLTIFASVSFSFVTLFVKILQDYLTDAYGSSFWRYLGITLPCIIIIYCEVKRKSVKNKNDEANSNSIFSTIWPINEEENWKNLIWLSAAGLIGSSAVIFRYYAVQYLSIGDASVIQFSTPVLVTVIAHFSLGEKCGVVPILVALTTLVGVVIMTKPPLLTGADSFDSETLIGSGLACGALICASFMVITVRKIRHMHFSLTTFFSGFLGLCQASIMAYGLKNGIELPQNTQHGLLVLGVALLSFFGQMAMIIALKFEEAGPVALFRSSEVIFGFILQFIFLAVVPDIWSYLGATIVLTCVTLIALRKWIQTLPESNCFRQKMRWLLY